MSQRKRRVVLIGPVLPFRGGIAQHTTRLHRALAGLAERTTLSFSRQYPTLLFPGASDRDPEYEEYREAGVEYRIDSLNPLSWRMAMRRALAFGPDTVILPWWTVYWAPCFRYLARALARHGVEVVFFCHNVTDHEGAAWKTWLTRMTLRHGHRFVVHTHADRERLERLLPGARVRVHPHPIYDQFPAPTGALRRRAPLELLFYGFVRPYKGVDLLVEAMARVAGDAHLTIAGEFWDGEQALRERITALGLEKRIELRPRYHGDAETAELFARADLVVLPYRDATGSGVIPIAYHYEKPVLVTRVGGLPEVVDDGETGFIVPPGDVDALAAAIDAFGGVDRRALVENIRARKRDMSWESLSALLVDADDWA